MPVDKKPAVISSDQLLHGIAARAETGSRETTNELPATVLRSLTGTPDTFVNRTGRATRIQDQLYVGLTGDVYSGRLFTRALGSKALADLVTLTDVGGAVSGFVGEMLVSAKLTDAEVCEIVDAALATRDGRVVSETVGALTNNRALSPETQRALIDYVLREHESGDIIDVRSGRFFRPNFDNPPKLDSLLDRLARNPRADLRMRAPLLAAMQKAPAELMRRTVLVALADPSSEVRLSAAPWVMTAVEPSLADIDTWLAAFFSADAKKRAHDAVAAQLQHIPTHPDHEGDVKEEGDFWPQRMENAGLMQAEFLGDLLRGATGKDDIIGLIERALTFKGISGLPLDVMNRLAELSLPTTRKADYLVRLAATIGTDDSEAQSRLQREALSLICAEPSVASSLASVLEPPHDALASVPVDERIDHLALNPKDARVTWALLRAGKISAERGLELAKLHGPSNALLAELLAKGADAKALLDLKLSSVDASSTREGIATTFALLQHADLPADQAGAALAELIDKSRLLSSANDPLLRLAPVAPRYPDPLEPAFPIPAGDDPARSMSTAMLSWWSHLQPSEAAVEAMADKLLDTSEPDRASSGLFVLLHAGLSSPRLAAAKAAKWEEIRANPEKLYGWMSLFLEPATKSGLLTGLEEKLVAATRAELQSAPPLAKQEGASLASLIDAVAQRPAAERLDALLAGLAEATQSGVERVPAHFAAELLARLPPAQARTLASAIGEATLAAAGTLWPAARDGAGFVRYEPGRSEKRRETEALIRRLVGTDLGRFFEPEQLVALASSGSTYWMDLRIFSERSASSEVAARLQELAPEMGEVRRTVSPAAEPTRASPADDLLPRADTPRKLVTEFHRGATVAELRAQFQDSFPLDWQGAARLASKQGEQAGIDHLLKSGRRKNNPAIDRSYDVEGPMVLACARGNGSETVRQQIIAAVMSDNAEVGARALALWDGDSFDFAMPFLLDAIGEISGSGEWLASFERSLARIASDERTSPEDCMTLIATAVTARRTRERFGDPLEVTPVLAAALARDDLSAAQRQTVLNAAIAVGTDVPAIETLWLHATEAERGQLRTYLVRNIMDLPSVPGSYLSREHRVSKLLPYFLAP